MKQKFKLSNIKGITLISLVVTIIILIILAGVSLYLILGQNGIIKKATIADTETVKQTATEAMNLKITSAQINTYAEKLEMPTLQELADEFCNDNDFEYVELQSKKVASLPQINVGTNSSIFTKLKEYPYEFEINSSLQLASIDGVQVATAPTTPGSSSNNNSITSSNIYSEDPQIIGTWIDGKTLYRKVVTITWGPQFISSAPTNITNIANVINLYGYTDAKDGNTYSINFNMGDNYIVLRVKIDAAGKVEFWGRHNNSSWFNGTTSYVVMEYTTLDSVEE